MDLIKDSLMRKMREANGKDPKSAPPAQASQRKRMEIENDYSHSKPAVPEAPKRPNQKADFEQEMIQLAQSECKLKK